MKIDDINKNLKVLAKVENNLKLTRNSGLGELGIDTNSLYNWVKRFYSNQSRNTMVEDLKYLVENIQEYIMLLSNSKYLMQDYVRENNFQHENNQVIYDLKLLSENIKDAIKGVEKLQYTYREDAKIVSEIDIVKNNMNKCIKDIECKVNIYISVGSMFS
jgi:hypothetical protein